MPKLRLHAHVFSLAPLRGKHALRNGLSILAMIVIGLAIDKYVGIGGQIAVSVASWMLMLYLVSQQTPAWRMTLVFGCALVCAAEMLLSIGLNWYDYQFHNVPPFVPPGHILLFMLAPPLARRVPAMALAFTPWLVAAYGLYAGISGSNTFDAVLACIFLLSWQRERSSRVYAVMLLLALGLELWGTWLGNWFWAHQVSYTGGLVTGNPPLLVGALYGMFDMLLMKLARHFHHKLGDVPNTDLAHYSPQSQPVQGVNA
jgi:hypothetical protein